MPVTTDSRPVFTGQAASLVRRIVTVVVFAIAALTFAFGFGQGWQLGLLLGVSGWIAPLVAPALDLSVVALLVATQYASAQGVKQLPGARLLLAFCGLTTLALTTAHPLLIGDYGRACFFAVPPLLLIGWSEVGPRLLAVLHGAVPDRPVVPDSSGAVRDARTSPSAELVTRARQLDAAQRAATGKPLTRDQLRAKLRVSNATVGAILRVLRADPSHSDAANGLRRQDFSSALAQR